ncbi:MAG: hypothetical protein HY905_15955 [Deltaproteobacteria bacterium]|nr:hypothetical protein [Deltaproteobacteria bacterium]
MRRRRRLAAVLASVMLVAPGCDCGAGDACANVDCSGAGRCAALPYGLGAYCVCNPGYHPVEGGVECAPNDASDPCVGVDCGGHGVCGRTGDGLPVCTCFAGWHVDESGLWCLPDRPPADGGSDAIGDGAGDADPDSLAEADGGEADVGEETDAEPWWADLWVHAPVPSKVDILVVVDNSGTMSQEQAALVQRFPEMIMELTDPRLDPGTGRPTHPPVEDLNIGVISPDLGSMGYPIAGCEDDPFDGDDGCLLHEPSVAVLGCETSYSSFLFRNDTNRESYDAATMAHDVACIGTLGTNGCNFEQPLRAMEKALGDNTAPGRCNAGFLRPDSLLALIVVTDEDDCSVDPAYPEMFDELEEELGPLNLRCHRFPEYVLSVEHFVSSFARLAPGRPGRVVLGLIVGVPPDAPACIGSAEDLEGCLDIPQMQEQVDPGYPDQLVPSCNTSMGQAYPPRRFLHLAREWQKFIGDAWVDSVCKTDWTDAIHGITDKLVDDIRDNMVCLSHEVAVDDATCMSPCWLFETTVDSAPCEDDPTCPQAWCPPATPETLDRMEPCRSPSAGEVCTPVERDLGMEYGTFGPRRCLIRQARRDPSEAHCGDFTTPLEAGWWVTPAEWTVPSPDWPAGCDMLRFYRPAGSEPPYLVDPATSTATLRCTR